MAGAPPRRKFSGLPQALSGLHSHFGKHQGSNFLWPVLTSTYLWPFEIVDSSWPQVALISSPASGSTRQAWVTS